MGDFRMCRRAALAAAGIALTLVLTGCGGGNGSAAASSGPAASSSSSGTTSSSGGSGTSSSDGGSSGSGSQPGTLTLNWTAPTQNTDGTPVTAGELAGYKILYGTTSNQLDESVAISSPTVTTYTFQDMPSGTYYFAVVSLDAEGNQSQQTNLVSATL